MNEIQAGGLGELRLSINYVGCKLNIFLYANKLMYQLSINYVGCKW